MGPRRASAFLGFKKLRLAILAFLPVFAGAEAAAALPPDAIDPPKWPRSEAIIDAPMPFSLSAYDALQAIAMIERERLLIRWGGGGREIVVAESVDAVEVDPLPGMPRNHRRRYDLFLNGEPLPWDEMYIRYGGQMLNLQLLFTYRNQRPVPDVPFVLPE